MHFLFYPVTARALNAHRRFNRKNRYIRSDYFTFLFGWFLISLMVIAIVIAIPVPTNGVVATIVEQIRNSR